MNLFRKYLAMSVVLGLVLAAPGACTSDEVAVEPTSKAPVGPGGTPVTTGPGLTSSSRAVEPDGGPITPDWTIREWKTVDGRPVSDKIIFARPGPEHCGWETVTFLSFGTPIGTEKSSGSDTQTFTRDPYGDLNRGAWQLVQFDGNAELPGDAEFSGYVSHGVALWISPSRLETEVCMVDGFKVEKWPRMDPSVGCA